MAMAQPMRTIPVPSPQVHRNSLQSIQEGLPGHVEESDELMPTGVVRPAHPTARIAPGPPEESAPMELHPLPPVEQLALELGDIINRQHSELRRRLDGFVLHSRQRPSKNSVGVCSPADGPEVWSARPSRSSFAMGRASWAFDQPGVPEHRRPSGRPTKSSRVLDEADQSTTSKYVWENQKKPRKTGRISEISMGDIITRRTTRDWTRTKSMPVWMKAVTANSSGWRINLLSMTNDWRYETANAFLILVNALLTAWETEYAATQLNSGSGEYYVPAHFVFVMFASCFFFTLDLVLRIIPRGVGMYGGKDWKWNVFDSVVVAGSWLEVVGYLGDVADNWLSNASVLRVLRLVRVSRVFRAFRFLVYFRDLRITVAMLCDAIIPLLTFSVIMAAVFMVFGIFFTAGVTAHMTSNGKDESLILYYGSLFKTMATLYMAITGGIDWENAATPLSKLSSLYSVVFYVYITFSILAMLNVVNAIFIDNTMQRSKNDRDYVVQTEMEAKRDFLFTMDTLFDELDPDRSGTIGLDELQSKIMDPKVNAYFRAIDLNVFKVTNLFQLMDRDDSGAIDKKEFREGCTRLRGEAKELDVAILQLEMSELTALSNDIFDRLSHLGEHIDRRFDEVAKSDATTHRPSLRPSLRPA